MKRLKDEYGSYFPGRAQRLLDLAEKAGARTRARKHLFEGAAAITALSRRADRFAKLFNESIRREKEASAIADRVMAVNDKVAALLNVGEDQPLDAVVARLEAMLKVAADREADVAQLRRDLEERKAAHSDIAERFRRVIEEREAIGHESAKLRQQVETLTASLAESRQENADLCNGKARAAATERTEGPAQAALDAIAEQVGAPAYQDNPEKTVKAVVDLRKAVDRLTHELAQTKKAYVDIKDTRSREREALGVDPHTTSDHAVHVARELQTALTKWRRQCDALEQENKQLKSDLFEARGHAHEKNDPVCAERDELRHALDAIAQNLGWGADVTAQPAFVVEYAKEQIAELQRLRAGKKDESDERARVRAELGVSVEASADEVLRLVRENTAVRRAFDPVLTQMAAAMGALGKTLAKVAGG